MRISVMCVMCGLVGVADAGRIESVGTVKVADRGMRIRQVGEARYLAVSDLADEGRDATVEVLDLDSDSIVRVATRRAPLARAFGNHLEGELVSYTPKLAGLHIADGTLERGGHHWYVELDPRTGKLARTASLGVFDDRADCFFLGTDAQRGEVWFYVTKYAEHLVRGAWHTHGPNELVLRRMDLGSLAVTDVMTIPLPARELKSGYEDRLSVHHAANFSRFAIVEYDERAFKTKPAGRIYIVDPEHRTTFSVAALDTTYGLAFAPDGKFIYLASAQLGTIARVDVTAQKIDKTVSGPMLTHDLVISPDGTKLLVVGSSTSYSELALPALDHRVTHPHAATIAPSAGQLAGEGAVSLDGRFYVMPALVAEPDHTVDPTALTSGSAAGRVLVATVQAGSRELVVARITN